jgi:hypothetical protein
VRYHHLSAEIPDLAGFHLFPLPPGSVIDRQSS